MAPSRASFVLLRDERLEREAFDVLLEVKVHEWVNALKK
jgi:hypothetical protein